MALRSVNPADGSVLETYPETSPAEADALLAAARDAFAAWRETGFERRAALMRVAAAALRERRDEYARLMAREMGKPVGQGAAEVDKCAWVCEHYADNARRFLEPVPVETDASRSYVTFRPLGVILAIMPWNFPFWQVFRFAAPTLMAGNGAVLKHAPNVTGCALAIEALFREAGFPDDLLRALLVADERVADVIRDPRIAGVTLTGSVRAGRAVAACSGEALKKTVLELGGSDPYVVLPDADLEATVETCVNSRLLNSGQSCIAAKRFIVPRPLREQFERRFTDLMRARRVGDPLAEGTDIGPQARVDLRDNLHDQVEESVRRGARRLLGGAPPASAGAWYPPTVLTDVGPGMPAYEQELFGPAAAIIPVEDEQEALAVASDTSYGLGAAIFTRDAARGERIAADRLEAGSCFVNTLVKSDPRLPFGGIKASGYGRELGEFGIREFVNVKSVYVR